MSFASDLPAFAQTVEQRSRDVFVDCTVELTRSMADGSELTGAPGQPVDTSAVKQDWANNGTFEGPWQWATGTNKDYGVVIEYDLPVGASGKKFSEVQVSEVGGTGSRAATVANWDKVVEHVRAKVVGS